jgi:hypothetical protein
VALGQYIAKFAFHSRNNDRPVKYNFHCKITTNRTAGRRKHPDIQTGMCHPTLLLILSFLRPTIALLTDNSTSSNNGGADSNLALSALFSDLTTTDIALLVLVCIIIAGILIYLIRQGARSRARLRQVRQQELNYAEAQLDRQSLPHVPFSITPTSIPPSSINAT